MNFIFFLQTDYLERCHVGDSEKMYVCGYAAKCIFKKLTCKLCIGLVLASKGAFSGDSYFDALQREGLSLPTDEVTFILIHMCAIFQYIVEDEKLLEKFHQNGKQKEILCVLTLMSLDSNDSLVDLNSVCTQCKTTSNSVFSMVCGIVSNIMLNNYKN